VKTNSQVMRSIVTLHGTIFTFLASLSLSAGIASIAAADPSSMTTTVRQSARVRSNANAATVYRNAFATLDTRRNAGLTDAEVDELNQLTSEGRVAPIDADRVRELLGRVQPFLDSIEPAASMRRSDFELDRAGGFEMRLPHLSRMRFSARLLRAQAGLAMHDGDWETSRESLRALASLSSHAAQDRVLISSLVGGAITQASLGPLDATLDEGTLTQERAKALAEALRPLRGDDPFMFGGATREEFNLLSATIAGRSGDEVAGVLGGALGPEGGGALAGMSERDIGRQLARAKEIYARAAGAFESRDPEAARRIMADLESEAKSNAVLQVLMPSFTRALEAKLRIGDELAERLARIDAIAEGRKTALEMANASTWLRRAAAIAASMPDEAQEAIELVLFAGHEADPQMQDRAVRTFLGAGRSIRESIDRALACGSLDLDIPNDGDYGLSMRWLPGLRAAARVLIAEAGLGDGGIAADRARLIAGVCNALVRDPSVTRSLVSRSIAKEARGLFERVAADESIDPAARAALGRSIRALAISEGLGLPKGLEADRDRLATGSPWGRVVDPVRRKHMTRRGPEFALFLQVALVPENEWLPLEDPNKSRAVSTVPATAPSQGSPPETSPVPAKPRPGPLVRFDDLLPPDRLVEARAAQSSVRASAFFEMLRTVPEEGDTMRNPFRGVSPVTIREYGPDLTEAAATASMLSSIADRFER